MSPRGRRALEQSYSLRSRDPSSRSSPGNGCSRPRKRPPSRSSPSSRRSPPSCSAPAWGTKSSMRSIWSVRRLCSRVFTCPSPAAWRASVALSSAARLPRPIPSIRRDVKVSRNLAISAALGPQSGLLREGSELVVGDAALTVHAFAERPDEVLLILFRTRFGKVFDQRDETENLIRCRFGPIGPQLLRDRQGPCVLPEDERPLPPDPLRLNRLV